jgi:phosphatidylglycerol:prolipoprotein diacylglycerol transferase
MVDAGVHVPWTRAFAVWNGGLVFYGGLLLAATLGTLHVHLRGASMLKALDAVGPVLALGLAFGRVGCTLNGCCWGREARAGELGMVFPIGSHPWIQHAKAVLPPAFDRAIEGAEGAVGEPLRTALERVAPDLLHGSHVLLPIQPIAVGLDLLLFTALLAYERWIAKRAGETFWATLVGYGLVRFTIEHLRGDHEDYVALLGYPLTVSQRVALLTAGAGLALLAVWRIRRPAVDLQDPKEKTQFVA